MAEVIKVEGLRELGRAFARADKDVADEFKDTLKKASEPVRSDAESLAGAKIRNLAAGSPWTEMRVGVTRSLVYVAPKQRRSKGNRKRKNMAELLRDRALDPALDQNIDEVEDRVDQMLKGIAADWGRF